MEKFWTITNTLIFATLLLSFIPQLANALGPQSPSPTCPMGLTEGKISSFMVWGDQVAIEFYPTSGESTFYRCKVLTTDQNKWGSTILDMIKIAASSTPVSSELRTSIIPENCEVIPPRETPFDVGNTWCGRVQINMH